MRVLIPTENRLIQTPDGAFWTTGYGDNRYWSKYLETFDEVILLARVSSEPAAPATAGRVDGDSVSVRALPYYIGPAQYIRVHFRIRNTVRSIVREYSQDAILLRPPGRISTLLHQVISDVGRPYGVEVVGDPYEVFAPGATSHPLRPWFRWSGVREVEKIVRDSCAAAYVTRESLQKRYPVSESTFSTYYSSIDLRSDLIKDEPRVFTTPLSEPRLILVGTLSQMYKGADILIHALDVLKSEDCKPSLKILGSGKYRSELESLVRELGLSDRVLFLGSVSAGLEVIRHLDASDLFVLPSRTEGLPKAMVEAMARGLPCIGTDVGGIPELLEDSALVPAGDVTALASKLSEISRDPVRMTLMSARNLTRSKEYQYETLQTRRIAMYEHLLKATRDRR